LQLSGTAAFAKPLDFTLTLTLSHQGRGNKKALTHQTKPSPLMGEGWERVNAAAREMPPIAQTKTALPAKEAPFR
jgi:hypothetical protein